MKPDGTPPGEDGQGFDGKAFVRRLQPPPGVYRILRADGGVH